MIKVFCLNPLKTRLPHHSVTPYIVGIFSHPETKDFDAYAFMDDPSAEKGSLHAAGLYKSNISFILSAPWIMRKIRPQILLGLASIYEPIFYFLRPRGSHYLLGLHGKLEKRWINDIDNYSLRSSLNYYVAMFLVSRAEIVFCPSEFVRQSILKKFPKKKAVVALNNIDPIRFNPEKRNRLWLEEKFHIPAEKPLAIHIAHMVKRKRPDIIFEIAKRTPEIEFLMVGREGYFKKEILLEWMKEAPNFHWEPLIDDMPGLLASSDVMIFPTLEEPFALAPIEALASGLPVIATKSGGTSELIDDGVEGFLIDYNEHEVDIFRKKVLQLCTNIELHKRFSEAARRKAVERFSWSYTPHAYAEAMRDLIKN